MKLVIYHFSDLHYSIEKRKDIEIIIRSLVFDINNFKEYFKDYKKIVIFAGDLFLNGENNNDENSFILDDFVTKILSSTGISENEFFIVPGNHDVNRNKITDTYEKGLYEKYKDNNSLNNLYDNPGFDFDIIKMRMTNYSDFRELMSSQSLIKSNLFYNSYKLDLPDNLSIGIIEFNNAWIDSGLRPNENNILLPEHAITDSLIDLKDTNIKIAISHFPLEMHSQFNYNSLYPYLIKHFDFYFTGHLHDSDFDYSQKLLGKLYHFKSAYLYNKKSK
ncbi:MAG TPA: metallophosphoesterase, partial [Ignavibacteria bacterium]